MMLVIKKRLEKILRRITNIILSEPHLGGDDVYNDLLYHLQDPIMNIYINSPFAVDLSNINNVLLYRINKTNEPRRF